MQSKSVKNSLALLLDVALFYAALALTLLIRHGSNFDYQIFQQHLVPFSYVLVIWLVTFYIAGLYDLRIGVPDLNFFTLAVRSLAVAAGLAVIFFYFTANFYFNIRPLTVLALQVFIFSALFILGRFLLAKLLSLQKLANKVLFVGGNSLTEEVEKELLNKPQLGFKPAGNVNLDKLNFNDPNDIKEICVREHIDALVVAPEVFQEPKTVSKIYQCLPLRVRIIDLPSFYEEVAGKIPISAIGQAWFLEKISVHRRRIYDAVKRAGDILLSLVLGLVALVITPLIALAIKLDSDGPVFFSQERVGQNGKLIKIFKFRTMVVNAESDGKPRWSQEGDKRITKVGSFLRKTRLDELPQLWNILIGDLSFVGPRPERPEFVQELTKKIPFYGERHLVKPGLTGWAQISLPYDASEEYSREKLQYDLYYIKNRGLLIDVGIVLRTIKSVLTKSGR